MTWIINQFQSPHRAAPHEGAPAVTDTSGTEAAALDAVEHLVFMETIKEFPAAYAMWLR